MPIIANRTGPLEVRQTSPLTVQQREALWAQIVRNWADQNRDRLAEMVEQGVPGKEAAGVGA